MRTKKAKIPDKWWEDRVKKLPLSENSLRKVHEMYELNWWHLTRSYRTKEGKKYQQRETVLNAKEIKIRAKIGTLIDLDEDYAVNGSYDRLLLLKLKECFISRNSLTKGDSCDILCGESGEGDSGEVGYK